MKLLSVVFAFLFSSFCLVSFPSLALAADGLVVAKSPHSVAETMNKFEVLAKERGLNVFARIDHAASAAKIGKTLRPTEVIIFGNLQRRHPFYGMRTDRRHRPAA